MTSECILVSCQVTAWSMWQAVNDKFMLYQLKFFYICKFYTYYASMLNFPYYARYYGNIMYTRKFYKPGRERRRDRLRRKDMDGGAMNWDPSSTEDIGDALNMAETAKKRGEDGKPLPFESWLLRHNECACAQGTCGSSLSELQSRATHWDWFAIQSKHEHKHR